MRRTHERVLGAVRFAATAWLALAGHLVRAQVGSAEVPPAETLVRASAVPVKIAAGGSADVRVRLTIQPGWHVNANPPALEYNIPTQGSIGSAGGLAAGAARLAKGA